jgi:hypothetical protein
VTVDLTVSVLAAIESNHANSADKDQSAQIIVFTVCHSISTHYDIFPQKYEWFCPDGKMDKSI